MEKIVLFGAGEQGKRVYDFLRYKNMENIVECFCDSSDNETEIEKTEKGVKVCNYESCKLQQKTFVISVTNENYVKEIEAILESNSENYFIDIHQWAMSQDIDRVEWNRDYCAWFHVDMMDEYYDKAELSINTFWGKDTVFYKMFKQLDLENVIELAVGHGRHVKMYEPWAKHIVAVDILQKNIDYCKERYKDSKKIDYLCNNGYNLKELNSGEYTALFCYDAMVHFEMMDIYEYLKDIYRVLKPNGMALLHHSNNTSDYRGSFSNSMAGARNYMSKDLFAYLSYRAGFEVVDQKVIDWEVKDLDCVTLLKKC